MTSGCRGTTRRLRFAAKPAGQRNRQPTTPDWTARNITALRTGGGNTPSTNGVSSKIFNPWNRKSQRHSAGCFFNEGELIPVGLDIRPLAEARRWSDIWSTRGVWKRKVRGTIRAIAPHFALCNSIPYLGYHILVLNFALP